MKVAVVGLGAVGGVLAARLSKSGHTVCGLARGATLRAVSDHGLRVIEPGHQFGEAREYVCPVKVSSSPLTLGPQDLVVIAVKGPALREVAASIAPLLHRDTIVLTAMNGVPWWFFARQDRPLANHRLRSVDPDGVLDDAIPSERVIGAVVMIASHCPMPSVVSLNLGNRLTIGEALGGETQRLGRLASDLTAARFEVATSFDVRRDVWYKLWGNMTANPISGFTGATYDRLIADPLVMAFAYRCMDEAAAIGARIGCPIEASGEELMVSAGRALGPFKTSMLQDVEAGRPTELAALLGAVREIGIEVDVSTPNIDALFGLARLHARMHDLYPGED